MSVPVCIIRVDDVELCARIEADGDTDQQIATLSQFKTEAKLPLEILCMIRIDVWRSNFLARWNYWLRLRKCGQNRCDTRSHLPSQLRARLRAATSPDPRADLNMQRARIWESDWIEEFGLELHETTLLEITQRFRSFAQSNAVQPLLEDSKELKSYSNDPSSEDSAFVLCLVFAYVIQDSIRLTISNQSTSTSAWT